MTPHTLMRAYMLALFLALAGFGAAAKAARADDAPAGTYKPVDPANYTCDALRAAKRKWGEWVLIRRAKAAGVPRDVIEERKSACK